MARDQEAEHTDTGEFLMLASLHLTRFTDTETRPLIGAMKGGLDAQFSISTWLFPLFVPAGSWRDSRRSLRVVAFARLPKGRAEGLKPSVPSVRPVATRHEESWATLDAWESAKVWQIRDNQLRRPKERIGPC